MIENGKTVLITGASDGLGKALSLLLVKKYDLNLALCGRSKEKLDALEKEIIELNPSTNLVIRNFDMLDETTIKNFVKEIVDTFSFVDILVNNAGANPKKNLVEEVDLNDFRYMMELNCVSYLNMIQALYPAMKERKEGHIVNILSSVCLFNNEMMAAYTASKQAMNAVHKILMKEARPHNVMVTGIYPGGIDTNFRELDRPDYMRPETVAKAILNLLELEDDAVPQDLVMRPFVEANY
jgi:Short-chain alcohol dehydrogenase of unknown specificity